MADKVYTAETVFTANTGPLFRTMSGLGPQLSTKMGAIGSAAGTAFSSAFTVGATAGLAALAGGAFLTGWSVKLASAAEETASLMTFVFKEATGKTIKDLDEFAAAAGRSRYELYQMAGSLGAILGPMGFTASKTGELSVKLTKLSTDLASFFNVTDSDAMVALRAALVGEAEPMRRLGVTLSEAKVQAEAFALGLAKTKDEVVGMVKTTAILSVITRETATATGDAVRTSGSWANTARALSGSIKDAGTSIGRVFLPAASELNKFLRGGVEYINQFSDDFIRWGQTIGEIAKNVLTQISALATRWRDVFTNVMSTAIQTLTGGAIKDFVGVIDKLLDYTSLLTQDFEKTWAAVKAGGALMAVTFAKAGVDFDRLLLGAIKTGFAMLPKVVQDGANLIVDGFNIILSGGQSLFLKLTAGFDSMIDHMIARVTGLTKSGGLLAGLAGAAGIGAATGSPSPAGPSGMDKISAAMAAAKSASGAGAGGIDKGSIDARNVFSGLSGFLDKLSGNLGAKQAGLIDELKGLFQGMEETRANKGTATTGKYTGPNYGSAIEGAIGKLPGFLSAIGAGGKGLLPEPTGRAAMGGVSWLPSDKKAMGDKARREEKLAALNITGPSASPLMDLLKSAGGALAGVTGGIAGTVAGAGAGLGGMAGQAAASSNVGGGGVRFIPLQDLNKDMQSQIMGGGKKQTAEKSAAMAAGFLKEIRDFVKKFADARAPTPAPVGMGP